MVSLLQQREPQERVPSSERPWLSPWSLAVLLVVSCVVTWTTMDRFQPPFGEKSVWIWPPGGADFFLTFAGARALVMGENPYLNDIPGFDDPWDRPIVEVEGKRFKTHYPPTHNFLFIPLALWTTDWLAAARILFAINMLLLFGLAVVTWWLLSHVKGWELEERRFSLLLVPLFFVVIAANIGTSLGLERGNGGDIASAMMFWGAVVLFLKGQRFLPMFLAIGATLVKGYGLIFLLGLGALCVKHRGWKAALAGTALGLAVFLLPVVRYVPEWWIWMQWRVQHTYFNTWMNYSFAYFFQHVSPSLAKPGWLAMFALYLATSLACWRRTRMALRSGMPGLAALWLSLFALTSLSTMVTGAVVSIIYSLVIILPGILVFLLAPDVFLRAVKLPPSAVHTLGILHVTTAFFLFKFKLDSPTFSTAALGLIVMVVTLGGSMLWGARRTPDA